MDLKLIRLVSGEEIICTLLDEVDVYTITNGFVLIPGGEGKIAFMPFMPYTKGSDDGVSIPKQHILFITEPVEELAAQIKTQMGIDESGLIVPQQGIIV